jgi:hypothetical protein
MGGRIKNRIIMTAPKRRWFQWSLRTLFVVVTVVAVFLAYHINWIRQRDNFIVDELAAYKRSHPSRDPWPVRNSKGVSGLRSHRAPGALWLFGEEGLVNVNVRVDGLPAEGLSVRDWERIQLARRLFPEAGISTIHVMDTLLTYDVKIGTPPDQQRSGATPAPNSRPH